jgi:hypothetical protein
VSWVTTATGHHCDRHGTDFRRGEVCHECTTDPGDADETYHAEYDRKLAARIAEYQSAARTLMRVGKELLGEPCQHGVKATDRDVAAACKAMAEATKLFRLAEERQEILDNREHELTLIAHDNEMAGIATGAGH